MITALAPSLLAIPGCGALTAAILAGEAADITQFRNRDTYAMWAGAAPIPVCSANNTRFRLIRGGHRQTNAALYRLAITQIRIHPDARAFVKRRLETGSTKREAIRLLKRKLANGSTETCSPTPNQPNSNAPLDIGETHIGIASSVPSHAVPSTPANQVDSHRRQTVGVKLPSGPRSSGDRAPVS